MYRSLSVIQLLGKLPTASVRIVETVENFPRFPYPIPLDLVKIIRYRLGYVIISFYTAAAGFRIARILLDASQPAFTQLRVLALLPRCFTMPCIAHRANVTDYMMKNCFGGQLSLVMVFFLSFFSFSFLIYMYIDMLLLYVDYIVLYKCIHAER